MDKNKYYLIAALLAAAGVGAYVLSNGTDETPTSVPSEVPASAPEDSNELSICSFNIMWLGHYKAIPRENEALANILKPYDIVVVQELTAPPVDGNYPAWFKSG